MIESVLYQSDAIEFVEMVVELRKLNAKRAKFENSIEDLAMDSMPIKLAVSKKRRSFPLRYVVK